MSPHDEQRAAGAAEADTAPLVCDVDGTLLRGDLLIEGVLRLLAEEPQMLLRLPGWLARGRAHLKRKVAEAVELPPDTLVFAPPVLAELKAAGAAGREVWLASAADARAVAPLARRVAARGYVASDGAVNLAGRAKAEALVARFGERGFDYIGDARRDLAVWRHARRAIGINLPRRLQRRVRALDREARFLATDDGGVRAYLNALRPYQWLKNALVFAPLLADHSVAPAPYLAAAVLFVALSACASGAYIFNDLRDLAHDRRHPRKRHRALASGALRLLPAIALSALLMSAGVALAFALSATAGRWALGYLLITLAYSLWLKTKLYADVVTLGLLYTLRVLAGGAVASVTPSHWLLAFSIFLFLALAITKRQAELHRMFESAPSRDSGRGAGRGSGRDFGRDYFAADRLALAALNAASGIAAVVVMLLYFHSPELSARYVRSELLWLLCPLILYWLGRITLLAGRGAMHDDPLVFTLRDKASWLCGAGALAVLVAASGGAG